MRAAGGPLDLKGRGGLLVPLGRRTRVEPHVSQKVARRGPPVGVAREALPHEVSSGLHARSRVSSLAPREGAKSGAHLRERGRERQRCVVVGDLPHGLDGVHAAPRRLRRGHLHHCARGTGRQGCRKSARRRLTGAADAPDVGLLRIDTRQLLDDLGRHPVRRANDAGGHAAGVHHRLLSRHSVERSRAPGWHAPAWRRQSLRASRCPAWHSGRGVSDRWQHAGARTWLSRRTFAPLMSRWAMPSLCRYCRPRSNWRVSFLMTASFSLYLLSTWLKLPLDMNSVKMYRHCGRGWPGTCARLLQRPAAGRMKRGAPLAGTASGSSSVCAPR
jgi:hypothetical protein